MTKPEKEQLYIVTKIRTRFAVSADVSADELTALVKKHSEMLSWAVSTSIDPANVPPELQNAGFSSEAVSSDVMNFFSYSDS